MLGVQGCKVVREPCIRTRQSTVYLLRSFAFRKVIVLFFGTTVTMAVAPIWPRKLMHCLVKYKEPEDACKNKEANG